MPPNLTSASIRVGGGTTSRTLSTRMGEVVNVKDFGAIGANWDGNDTAAIQAAFDYAFGPYNNPHGGVHPTGPTTNRAVYFPPGYYMTYSPIAEKAVLNVAGNGTGLYPSGPPYYDAIVVTVASTAGLANGDMVYIRGVGGVNFANSSFAIDTVTATTFRLRNSQWNQAAYGGAAHTYTSGGTVNVPALKFRALGALIYGSGRETTILRSGTQNAALISTNGFSYSFVRDMAFSAARGGIAFDYNTDGDVDGFNISGTSNTFMNIGAGGDHPDYGLAFGMGMVMADSTTIFNGYIGGCDIAGVYVHNQNSLAHAFYGGNISQCKTGIWIHGGSMPVIHGVAFQNYQEATFPGGVQVADIYIEGAQADAYAITGCRSESPRFLLTGEVAPIAVNGCAQTGGTGFFYSGHGNPTFNSCSSNAGFIESDGGKLVFNNCAFSSADYLTRGTDNYAFLSIVPLRTTEQTAATYTIGGYDCGTRVQFNRATAQTVTIPSNHPTTGTIRLIAGSIIDVQQTGAGKTTFAGAAGVTIRSRGSLKSLNGQYACGRLTCDGTDIWTLSGDIIA